MSECLENSSGETETSAETRIQLPPKWEKLAHKFYLRTTNTFETFQTKA